MARRRLQLAACLATVALVSAAAYAEDISTQLIPPLPGAPETDAAALAQIPRLAWVTRKYGLDDGKFEIWRTGGTPETTYLVTTVDIPIDPQLGRHVRFVESEDGRTAWLETQVKGETHRLRWTDGTPGLLEPVTVPEGELELRTATLMPSGGGLFVLDRSPGESFAGRMLRLDADAPGVASVLPLLDEEGLSRTSSIVQGRELHFERRGSSVALVSTDGTSKGTKLLVAGLPARVDGTGAVAAYFIGRGGERAQFVTYSGAGASMLWTTDGTTTGTRPVALLAIASESSEVADAAETSRFALATVFTGTDTVSLLVTDGTDAGTFHATQQGARHAGIPEDSNLSPFWAVAGRHRGWFIAKVGDGSGVWTTDGTRAGTLPLPRVDDPARGFSITGLPVPLDAPDGAVFVSGHDAGAVAWYTSPSQFSRRIAVGTPDPSKWTVHPPRTVGRRLLVGAGVDANLTWSVALLDDLTIRPGRIDTDSDGIFDEVEEQLGASAFDAAETPIGGAAGPAKPLTVTRVRGRVEGTAATIDAVATIRLRAPKGRAAPRLGKVAVSFGGVVTQFDVGRRGTASLPDGSSFRMRTRTARNGSVTGTVSFRIVAPSGAPRLTDEFGTTDDTTGVPYRSAQSTLVDVSLFTTAAWWRGRVAADSTANTDGSFSFRRPRGSTATW